MQNAETVLGVLRERGRKGLPCDELYRQLFNPQLYLLAYGRIYSNHGAMTPGATQETADGMSMEKIGAIIEAMRHERYRFSPVRRIYIPKRNGKLRPLGLPTWSDKLVGEVVRLLLEAYYEPTFSDRSHGFRPGRGCHTALREVATAWTGTTWFIEGDISDCFGQSGSRRHARDPGGEDPRQPVPAAGAQHAQAGYLEDWLGTPRSAARRRAVSCHPSCPRSTCTSWTTSSRQFSSRNTPEGARRANPDTTRSGKHYGGRASAVTGHRPGSCNGRCVASEPGSRTIPATGGCATPATPTIISWVSSDRRPKPSRSKTSWRRSCATNSSWNSTRTRHWSRTPAPGRRDTSATRSSPNAATRRSPAVDGRSTARSRCACHSM